ncbi:MAG: glycosyltransferase family 2 protein [Proteobacteria bacterium]|nr:glycosyltransferase family 2 protein [Pseudomonadota bacterium]
MLSLVICTLNEGQAIGPLLDETRAALGAALGHSGFEIIVVDDDSSDGTGRAVQAAAAQDSRVRLIVRKGVRGLASAAVRGWDEAGGEVLALMDGDGQHDPALIPRLAAAVSEGGAELAIGSRYMSDAASGLTGRRHWISRAATRMAGLVLRAPLRDPMSGCFAMRRDWYEAARPKLSTVGFKILLDLVASSPRAPRIAELATALRPRRGGESKLDLRVMLDLASLLIEKRTGRLIPSRFVEFSLVGASGVLVNLTVLALLGALPFWAAFGIATVVAMTSNYWLNTLLTYRDQRLRGWLRWRGLLMFYLACSGGALLGQGVGNGLLVAGAPRALAGLAGALSGGVWNYLATRWMIWGAERRRPAGAS